jgi:long-chain fatty acid transport protein
MKEHRIGVWVAVASLLFFPGLVHASGYGINELGTKALGLGGAFVAQADDPSAVYFNPAGIVQLEGTQFCVGVNTVTPTAEFESAGTSGIAGTAKGQTTEIRDHTFPIPNAYITHKYNDKLSFGFGQYSNFGLSTDWPRDWEGRYILGGNLAEIKTLSFSPVVAFRPHKRVSFGVGPVFQYYEIEVKYTTFVAVPNPAAPPAFLVSPTDVDTKLHGDDLAVGVNVSVLVWITDNLKFGAAYHSEVDHDITDGQASFGPEIPLAGIQNTAVKASLTSPAIAYLGICWTHGPLTLEFDGQWTEWSTFDDLYAAFDTPVGGKPGLAATFKWENTWAYRFGAQYTVNEYLDLRAGIVYDEQAVPSDQFSPLLPSGDRWIYSFGAGTRLKGFTLDFAYNYLDDEKRTFDNEKGEVGPPASGRITGKFKDVDAHIFGLNLTYRF